MTLSSKTYLPSAAPRTIDAMLNLAMMHRQAMEKLHETLVEMTGEAEPDNGVCQEAVWDGGLSAADLIARLGLEIREVAA